MGIRFLRISTVLKFDDGIPSDDRREIQDSAVATIQAQWDKVMPCDYEILDHVTGAEWASRAVVS